MLYKLKYISKKEIKLLKLLIVIEIKIKVEQILLV